MKWRKIWSWEKENVVLENDNYKFTTGSDKQQGNFAFYGLPKLKLPP